ncbi:hypothetical protein GALL_424580 [mine drainage metagenome]|uniref:Uncharacterized protein n=1 Tax=mine drainage metagenome TaxID=410659 RepID=A0A1J5PWK7_9ZZZZ
MIDVAPMAAISPKADTSASSVARVLQGIDDTGVILESELRSPMNSVRLERELPGLSVCVWCLRMRSTFRVGPLRNLSIPR